jgi:UDP-glucose:(heptosyl)LPS alpha-1,3-glucosyltransferase
MKLAVICRAFSFHGGIETATAGLIAELLRRGHAIDLLSTRAQEAMPGVRVRKLPTLGQPSLLRFLSFALAARRAVAGGGGYDIVQSHERVLSQDIYRAGEGTHRGYLRAMGRHADRVNPYHQVVRAVEKRIFTLRCARHIVAISRGGKDEIERLYASPPERVSLVYNGVDLQRFHPEQRARFGGATRDALGIERGSWVIVFVGSGFERKGLGPLLEAVSRLGNPACRLVVAGKGDVKPYQTLAGRLGIADRVRFTGARRDVERLYAAADIVALPALYEPFGNVHLEALASGVPVLTSARAGGSEVITSGQTGWVVSEPTATAIAEGLRALQDGHRATIAQRARESAEPFTYAAQADGFEALYRQLKR